MTVLTEFESDVLAAAQGRLAAAVAALLQPTTQPLARVRALDPDVIATNRDADADHAARMHVLRARHAAYGRRKDAAGMRRSLAALIERENAHQAAKRARSAGVADLPSLLDQLVDAVSSSQGGGGASAGPHRWIFGVDASELLGSIRRTVSARSTADLAVRLRSWAGLAGHWRTENPDRLLANAFAAESWVAEAHEVLEPRRKMTAVGSCPECLCATTFALDDLGEWVRKPALEIDVRSGWARCTVAGCTAQWSPEQLPLLAAVLEQQAAEARTSG